VQDWVLIDCPSALLEVLFARQVWQLAVLPDIPLLDVAPTDMAVRPLDILTVAEARSQCEDLWFAYLSWRSEMHKPPVAAHPPSWRSKYGYANLDERVMRDFVGRVRDRTMTDLRRYGPVTVESLRAATRAAPAFAGHAILRSDGSRDLDLKRRG
jgi:hypothetical protein